MNYNLYIETYGCQMNFSDSEIVASIMKDKGFSIVDNYMEADIILMNTCSIRDNAEQRVLNRLNEFKSRKTKKPDTKIGVIGCMAERLKEELLKKGMEVDIVAGPDSYRHLPDLIEEVQTGRQAINVLLSKEETYEDIEPIRINSNGISAFISIMRGCENFCSYCVVPYTRGKERSRSSETILNEVKELHEKGYKEITLLGQNVNSYLDDTGVDFPLLLKKIAESVNKMRIRFATSHPKDISDELIYTISKYDNICKSIHLPVQSGSNRILDLMNRKYSKEWYLDRINKIKSTIPNVTLSTDIIAGFCGETDDDHKQTLDLMEQVGYSYAFMFKYSERPNTSAAKKLKDDVDEKIKVKRLNEIISLQGKLSEISNKNDIGKVYEVLIENVSKRSNEHFSGRTSQNKVVIFPKENYSIGDFVNVLIEDCTPATLKGKIV